MKVKVSGGTNNYGIKQGSLGTLKLKDVAIDAVGLGEVYYGVHVVNGDVEIEGSKIEASGLGASKAIYIDPGTSAARVALTMLAGGVSGSNFTCFGSYDGNFLLLGSTTCQ